MTFMIEECGECQRVCFPARYCCPYCGANQWHSVQAGTAHVAQITTVRSRIGVQPGKELFLASIQLQKGPVVIAQAEALLLPGTAVELNVDSQQRIVVHPILS